MAFWTPCFAYPMPAMMPLHSAVDKLISKNKMQIIMNTQVTLHRKHRICVRATSCCSLIHAHVTNIWR